MQPISFGTLAPSKKHTAVGESAGNAAAEPLMGNNYEMSNLRGEGNV
jgi:hypothetical protein